MKAIKSLKFLMDPFFYDQDTKVFKHHLASVLEKGASFGELAIMRLVPRSGSAICREDSLLGLLDSATFRKILNNEHQKKIERKMNFFKENLLFDMDYNDQVKISYFFQKLKGSYGKELFRQGEEIQNVILILEGDVEISKKVKIDVFNFSKNKKLKKLEAEILKVGVKKKYGIENDLIWQQRITIGGPSMFLGGIEVLNHLKNGEDLHRKPELRKIYSDYTVKVVSQKFKYYQCDAASFQGIIETYPRFKENIEPVLIKNNNEFLKKIDNIKEAKRKEIIANFNISKTNMDMERSGLTKNVFKQVNEKDYEDKKWNFGTVRGQLESGIFIDKLIRLKEKMLRIKQNNNLRMRKSSYVDLYDESFLTTKSIKIRRRRRDRQDDPEDVFFENNDSKKGSKRTIKYSKIKDDLIELDSFSKVLKPKNSLIEVKNFEEIAHQKLRKALETKVESKNTSNLSFLKNRGKIRTKKKKVKKFRNMIGNYSVRHNQSLEDDMARYSMRTQEKINKKSISLADINIKDFGIDEPSESRNNTLITEIVPKSDKKKKERSKTANFNKNSSNKNYIFSHTKDTENSIKSKFNANILHKERKRKDTWKRDSPFINSLVLKSQRQKRLKSAFQRVKTQEEYDSIKRSFSLEKELELPLVKKDKSMVRKRKEYGPDFYFRRIYEDRFDLTFGQLKKLRNGLKEDKGKEDFKKSNRKNNEKFRYYI